MHPSEAVPELPYLRMDRKGNREYFWEKIVGIHEVGNGSFWISFEMSARHHLIDAEKSLGASEMVTLAREAQAAERGVYVTIDTSDTPTVNPPPARGGSGTGMPVILRMAYTPDPKARD